MANYLHFRYAKDYVYAVQTLSLLRVWTILTGSFITTNYDFAYFPSIS